MVKTFRFDNIYSDELCSNTYVIGEEKGPFLIVDIGTTNERIFDYLKGHHTYCLGVLLTHGHFDHFRGIANFLKRYNCTVFIDEKDKELLTNPRLNCSKMSGENISVDLDNIYYLDDEDEINFINKYYVKIIETPFHTKGSVCFLIKSENALFTGDTLFKNSIGRSDLPTGSNKTISSSLKKIINLNEDLNVYPGHGELTTLKLEKQKNIYLKEINKDD